MEIIRIDLKPGDTVDSGGNEVTFGNNTLFVVGNTVTIGRNAHCDAGNIYYTGDKIYLIV